MKTPITRRTAPLSGSSIPALALILALAALLALGSCRTEAPEDPNGGLTLSLDAVPLLLKSDSASVSTIWCTVLEKGRPAPDSTLVSFVATFGRITEEAATRDGLARATFDPRGETGAAAIIAQVRALRDTVLVTVY